MPFLSVYACLFVYFFLFVLFLSSLGAPEIVFSLQTASVSENNNSHNCPPENYIIFGSSADFQLKVLNIQSLATL